LELFNLGFAAFLSTAEIGSVISDESCGSVFPQRPVVRAILERLMAQVDRQGFQAYRGIHTRPESVERIDARACRTSVKAEFVLFKSNRSKFVNGIQRKAYSLRHTRVRGFAAGVGKGDLEKRVSETEGIRRELSDA